MAKGALVADTVAAMDGRGEAHGAHPGELASGDAD
jgi:hypothetical protein